EARRLWEALGREDASAEELAQALDWSAATVLAALFELEEAGLASADQQGRYGPRRGRSEPPGGGGQAPPARRDKELVYIDEPTSGLRFRAGYGSFLRPMSARKSVVIVESPAKAKTLEKFLGKNFRVLASYGHVRDLPKKGLGVDRSNSYEPTYEV